MHSHLFSQKVLFFKTFVMITVRAELLICAISTVQVRVPYRVVGLVVGPKGESVIGSLFRSILCSSNS